MNLDNITRVISLDDLIDRESKRFKDRGMQFMVFDIEEELLSDPLFLITPIVRNEKIGNSWLPTGGLERVEKIKVKGMFPHK